MSKLFNTLEQSLRTKKAVVVESSDFEHKGLPRKSLKVRKGNGSKIFYVTQYNNGLFSEAV